MSRGDLSLDLIEIASTIEKTGVLSIQPGKKMIDPRQRDRIVCKRRSRADEECGLQ